MVKLIKDLNLRLNKLTSNFTDYISKFNSINKFTGPSLYFHFKTLEKLHSYKNFEQIFEDNLFFEYVYATLTSWGLHRMGPIGSKLVSFDIFKKSIQEQKARLIELQNKNIFSLSKEEIPNVIDNLWDIINNISVSATQTKLIAGSKAIHHFLPKIIPPIDREYTITFFYGRGAFPKGQDERIFREIYPYFYKIASENQNVIKPLIGKGFHTSETKVIDNAIVGFVSDELRS